MAGCGVKSGKAYNYNPKANSTRNGIGIFKSPAVLKAFPYVPIFILSMGRL
jgi:hypothetical protein